MWVLHRTLTRNAITALSLLGLSLLLHVVLVRHSLLLSIAGHSAADSAWHATHASGAHTAWHTTGSGSAHAVAWVHWGGLHAWAAGLLWEVLWCWLLWGGGVVVEWVAVLVQSGWLWSVETGLNQVLALGLGDKWLELWRGEGVNESSLRDDKEENLGSS